MDMPKVHAMIVDMLAQSETPQPVSQN